MRERGVVRRAFDFPAALGLGFVSSTSTVARSSKPFFSPLSCAVRFAAVPHSRLD